MTAPNEARPEWEPVAWMMDWTNHYPSFTTDKSDYVSWFAGKASYPSQLKPLYGPAVKTEMLRAQEEARVLREALSDAATSLETVFRLAGRETYGNPPLETFMDDFVRVRAYAKSRCDVARAALKGTP